MLEHKSTKRKLTPRDVVMGIGRKATDAEWDDYFNRCEKGRGKSADSLLKEIKSHLEKRQNKRKAS